MELLIEISDEIENKYGKSLNKVIRSIEQDNKLSNIKIQVEKYSFTKDELSQIKEKPSDFLDSKGKTIVNKKVNALIYIPDPSINLKSNYLWYGRGRPRRRIMVISSYLFEELIKGRLEFGAYIFVLYSQTLARWAVDLENPHQKSKKCLNDHCTYQIELLNVFQNKKDILCDDCLNNIKKGWEAYYEIAKNLITNLKKFYYEEKVEPKKEKPEEIKTKSQMKEKDGDLFWYEFEIYMAKKCTNMYKLYKKLNEVLRDGSKEIDGYSLFEVGGGWREEIELNYASEALPVKFNLPEISGFCL